MISWGIVVGCMAIISKPWHFYLLRFLLVRSAFFVSQLYHIYMILLT
jgi:hypothetical protein